MLESMKKNKAGILLMCVSSVCACVGQLFWKLSAKEGILLLLFGFLFYGAGAFIMLIAYRFGSLSVLQPVLSLNYVFSVILGAAILNEPVTILKVAGVLVIITGVLFIAGGDE
jgi:drug/metabolite transporter (DMT)-like permease